MPTPTVWIVTRRPKRHYVGVAGGLKGAQDLAVADAELLAKEAFGDAAALTWWSEHGEAPEPGKKFTRASIHFAQVNGVREPKWTQTVGLITPARFRLIAASPNF